MTLRTDDLSAVAGPRSGFGSNFLNSDMAALFVICEGDEKLRVFLVRGKCRASVLHFIFMVSEVGIASKILKETA